MNDDLALSRLLDGDLPPAETAALRARLATEPALAARYAALQTLVRGLQGLPTSLPPPGPPRALVAPRSSRRWLWTVPAFALAASALWALPSTPELVLTSGTTLVHGRAAVWAAGVPLQVDGDVRVTVEPPPGAARVDEAEIETMDKSHLAAALAGSLVTIAVVSGHASLAADPSGPALTLDAGASTHRTAGAVKVAPNPTTAAAPDTLVAARARIADLERQLAVARFDAGVSHGAVVSHEGTPAAWPSDVPAGFRPDASRARLDAAVRTLPGTTVAAYDCDEFPCIAVLRSGDTAEDWTERFGELHRQLSDGLGDVAITAMASATDDGSGEDRLYALALAPGPTSSEVDVRTRFRAQSLLEETAEPREDLRVLGYGSGD